MRKNARLLRSTVVTAAMMAAASSVDAQTCIGLPRTSSAPVNLTGFAALPDNQTTLGARLGFGGQNGFGGVTVGYTDFDNVDKGAVTFGGDIGYSVPVNNSRTTSICPLVNLGYTTGPNVGNIDRNALSLLAGVGLGGEVDATSNLTLNPFGTLGVLHQRVNAENGENEVTASETGAQLGLGLSFRVNRVFSITPSVAIPLGFDNNPDPYFSIAMSLGFRGGR